MSKKLAEIRQGVRQLLQDEFTGSDLIWADDEIDLRINQALKEIDNYCPYLLKVEAESDGTKKIDINDITDVNFDIVNFIDVLYAEYEVDQDPEQLRSISRFGDIITLKLETAPTSGDAIYLYCTMHHNLTEDTSNLTPALEEILIQWTSALSASSKSMDLYSVTKELTTELTAINTAIGNISGRITQALSDISDGNTEVAKIDDILDDVNTEVDIMNARVDQAVTDIASGRALANKVLEGNNDYFQSASSEINAAQGYLSDAIGYLREATGRGNNNSEYLKQASAQFQAASTYMNQATGYIRQINVKLSIASSGKLMENWADKNLVLAKQNLNIAKEPVTRTLAKRWTNFPRV
jgi:hypothetical protein